MSEMGTLNVNFRRVVLPAGSYGPNRHVYRDFLFGAKIAFVDCVDPR